MSWKSLVTASLLCALVSPAFAAPTVQVVKGGSEATGHLNAAGNWVWTVRLSQSSPIVDIDNEGPITPGSPLAAELTFTATGSPLVAGGTSINATDFDDANPGNDPGTGWEWLVLTPLGGTGECNSGDPGDCPVGLQVNTGTGQIFSAFGSVDYGTDPDGKVYMTITTDGPNSAQLSSTVTMGGAYAGNGRIAELNDAYDGDGTPPISLNYSNYAGAFTRTAGAGDANLDGLTNDSDLSLVLSNFNASPRVWQQGNFNNQTDNVVNDSDLSILLSNFNGAQPVGPGGGAGGGGAVPEPTTMALVALAGLGLAGLRRRS